MIIIICRNMHQTLHAGDEIPMDWRCSCGQIAGQPENVQISKVHVPLDQVLEHAKVWAEAVEGKRGMLARKWRREKLPGWQNVLIACFGSRACKWLDIKLVATPLPRQENDMVRERFELVRKDEKLAGDTIWVKRKV